MKKQSIVMTFLSLIFLAACSNNSAYFQSQAQSNLLKETWMNQTKLNPNQWTYSADKWFFTGEPNQTELRSTVAPLSTAMTVMAVEVPQFTRLNINGNFQVQIVGYQDKNTLFILGPNAAARLAAVEIHGNTLSIHQASECETCFKEVIIRIGVKQLHELCIVGDGAVTGRNLLSDHLSVYSYGTGPILLAGNIHLTQLIQTGSATLSILGIHTNQLNMKVMNGTVNLSGRVGVQNIQNMGWGRINIAGVNTRSLNLATFDNSKTILNGLIGLRKLIAKDNSEAYLVSIQSPLVQILESDNARIGLAGNIDTLKINLFNHSRFEGKYLSANQIYIRSHDNSHANIKVLQKLFAAADNNSSIYYLTVNGSVSQFTSQRGTIIPAN